MTGPKKSSKEPESKPDKWFVLIPVFGLMIAIAGAVAVVRAGKKETPESVSATPESPESKAATPDPEPVTPPVSDTSPPSGQASSQKVEAVASASYRRVAEKMQFHTNLPVKQKPRVVHWFGGIPSKLFQTAVHPGNHSNIRKEDYAGAQSCKECHARNFERWSKHPHRFMNAYATREIVRGDFSGKQEMKYMGGRASFYMEGDAYRMRLERDGVRREFDIVRTIGSRFFQYYIGKLIAGPEPKDHPLRKVDHVLPLGYWFEPEEWVPIVNVGGEKPDELRDDPFVVPSTLPYDQKCSACHTTKPVGDLLLDAGMMNRIHAYGPRVMHFDAESYIAEEHPQLIAHLASSPKLGTDQIEGVLNESMHLPVADHAVAVGVSCEGCHNGAAAHARNAKEMPSFFPRSEKLVMEGENADEVWGRNDVNINWTCSRCHAGGRKRYANGISTWNSTELTDAARGSCYNAFKARERGRRHLTCVHCHDPHTAIGEKWSRTPQQDNASCIECHGKFEDSAVLAAHTHHAPTSSGSECMNCHMPRINEGLQDLVRTHTIFSPTDREMLESNQPNACNMCHVDETIGWTMKHLKDWFGAEDIPAARLNAAYPEPGKSAVQNWLASKHTGTRLVAADVLARQKAEWGIPHLLDAMDDPYLINRQFAARSLELFTGVDARDHGYRFYMFKDERAEPLRKLREVMLEGAKTSE